MKVKKETKTKFIIMAASGIASLFFGMGILVALFSQLPFLLLVIIGVFGFLSAVVQYFRCKKMYDYARGKKVTGFSDEKLRL